MSPSFWLVAFVVIAFFAVGCSSRPPVAVNDVPTLAPIATAVPARVEPTRPTAAAQIAIDPQPARQAGQVRLTGSGFSAGESISITVARKADTPSDVLPLTIVTASDNGTFDSGTVPLADELQSGPHPIEAVGGTSSTRAAGTLWIRAPQPWLVLDKYDVPQYGDVGLIAGGFDPMDNVDVTMQQADGARTSARLASMSTDQAGNTQWLQFKLPSLAAGTYAIVLRGHASPAELRREIHVTMLKPVVELSPWAGPPGVPVQLNARGFAPNERIRVTLGGAASSDAEVQADEYGNLWGAGPVRIPQNASTGSLLINLIGEDTGATAQPEFKVLDAKPWLELTTWSGAPGAPVGFGGGGWIGGERVSIHIGSSSAPAQATGNADDNGWLKGAGEVYIPTTVGDDDVIFVAVGEQSHLVAAATFKVVFPFGLRPAEQSGNNPGAARP